VVHKLETTILFGSLLLDINIIIFTFIYIYIYIDLGTAVAQWLGRCATNRKVSGSIPGGVIGIFH